MGSKSAWARNEGGFTERVSLADGGKAVLTWIVGPYQYRWTVLVAGMNVSQVAVVAVAVLAVAVVATGGAVGQEQVTLTVSVTDQEGDTVGGVSVEATWETESGETGTVTGTTASNGNVLLDAPANATVELDVDDDRYVRNRPLRIENASEADVALGVSRSGTATVSVLDPQNQTLTDAAVAVRENGRAIDRGTTGSDGTYETARLERGTYEIEVVKPGYFEESREVTVSANTEASVTIERGTTTLDVRVFDDHFDPPAAIETGSVRVSSSVFDGEVTVTEGTASLTVPVNALYTVEVVKDGYDPSLERVRVRESATATNVTAQRVPALTVAPANDRVLVGETTRVTVRNAYDEPATGVTVVVDGEAVGETDDRGEIDVEISSTGNRTIVARSDDAESDPVTVEGVETAEEADSDADGENGSDADGDDGSDATDDGAPGFGVVAAVIAVLAAAAVVGRRQGLSTPTGLREALAPDTTAGWVLLLVVVLPIIAGFEELLFRGALIGVVHAGFGVSTWLLVGGSSVVFALGHGAQGRLGIVVTGLLGVGLATVFVLTGSLLVVIVAHYVINALEFVVHEGLDRGYCSHK